VNHNQKHVETLLPALPSPPAKTHPSLCRNSLFLLPQKESPCVFNQSSVLLPIQPSPNQIITTAARISIPTTTARSLNIAVDLASLAGTADGNLNPDVLVPSACTAPAPAAAPGGAVAVIRNPFESNDLGPGVAFGSIVKKIGKPCWSHLVTTSRPELNDEPDGGEEGNCAGVGWKFDCNRE